MLEHFFTRLAQTEASEGKDFETLLHKSRFETSKHLRRNPWRIVPCTASASWCFHFHSIWFLGLAWMSLLIEAYSLCSVSAGTSHSWLCWYEGVAEFCRFSLFRIINKEAPVASQRGPSRFEYSMDGKACVLEAYYVSSADIHSVSIPANKLYKQSV